MSFNRTSVILRIQQRAQILFAGDFQAFAESELDAAIDRLLLRLIRESLDSILSDVLRDEKLQDKLGSALRLD